jgi:uncharacterized protein
MVEKEAVANTSSILFLAKIKRFDLLKNMFQKVLIPDEVFDEIFSKDSTENELIKGEMQDFIQKENVKKIKDLDLDEGEKAAISLCLERAIRIFISDDKKARKFARSLDILTIGLAGIIKYNLQEKQITREEAKELVNKLIKNDYYMSSSLYTEIMEFIDKN